MCSGSNLLICVCVRVCVQEYDAGMQKYYNVFSLLSGKEYVVQVRCKPDHGFWSEWTNPVYVQMPECKKSSAHFLFEA